MKRFFVILLALAMLFAISGCAELEALKAVELPPLPEPEVSAEPAISAEPEISAEPVAEEKKLELGSSVLVSIGENTEVHYAPDNENQRILTFSYDEAIVHIDGNDTASAAINDEISLLNELYYSGTGNGDGLNVMLEQALDNYGYAQSSGEELSIEFSSVRDISIPRADSKLVTLLMHTHIFAGEETGANFDRAYVFSSETGKLLSLEDVANDYEALVSALQVAVESCAAELNMETVEDISAAAAALVREGSWYFGNDGIVIFSDAGEIADYERGIISFNIGYKEVADKLNADYSPVARDGEGSLDIAFMDSIEAGSLEIMDRVDVNAEGEELCLSVEGVVYDLTISTVEYSGQFYVTGNNWYSSYVEDAAIQLHADIPEGMPTLRISYTDAAGKSFIRYLTQSGKDGRLILLDNSSISTLG